MSKPQLRYIADLKNLEEHEQELRTAALSAAQAKNRGDYAGVLSQCNGGR